MLRQDEPKTPQPAQEPARARAVWVEPQVEIMALGSAALTKA